MTTTTTSAPAAAAAPGGATAAAAQGDGERKRLGPAWHRRVAGLHVVKLKGTMAEMARQHGVLLRDAIPRGPLVYYRTYIERVLARAGLGRLAPLGRRLVRWLIGRRVEAKLPPFARDAIRALADGAGLDERDLLEACTMPDSLMWLVARVQARVPRAAEHRAALGLGCSSVIAWDGATRDGRLLHGRNFDYQGVAPWPREAAVIFHEPDEGLRYVSVASAGILFGGATAMNEAGLTLTVHQHMFTDRTRLGGTPIGVVGDIVMREARDLDRAAEILGAHRPIGCWTYLVADGPRGEVLCHEEDPDRRVDLRFGAGRPPAPDLPPATFRYANIYLDPELGATEKDLYPSYWRANRGRFERMGERLRETAGARNGGAPSPEPSPPGERERGGIDADWVASVLGDEGSGPCRLRAPLAMLMTVGSTVMRPEDGVLWVATGEAPVSQNRYEPFSLEAEDHAPEHAALTGGVPSDAVDAEAFAAYREGYVAWFDADDRDAARRHVARAAERKPEEPLYHALSGLVAIACADAAGALRAFDRAIALGHPDPEREASFRLWRGRAKDLLGRREEALADYRAALDRPAIDAAAARAAEDGRRRPFSERRARRVAVEFAFADVVAP